MTFHNRRAPTSVYALVDPRGQEVFYVGAAA